MSLAAAVMDAGNGNLMMDVERESIDIGEEINLYVTAQRRSGTCVILKRKLIEKHEKYGIFVSPSGVRYCYNWFDIIELSRKPEGIEKYITERQALLGEIN